MTTENFGSSEKSTLAEIVNFVDQGCLTLEILNDSMLPEFEPGDEVVIDLESTPEHGEFAAATNPSGLLTVRKYLEHGRDEKGEILFELVALNPEFETMRSDQQPLTIIGPAVERRRRLVRSQQ